MNYRLEVCLVALALATSITPSVATQSPGPALKPIRRAEAPGRAAQALRQGISVELAVTSNAVPMPDADNGDALIVTVSDSGSVYFRINPVTPAVLAEKLKGSLSNPGQKLYIKADARTPYANVVKVLEAARTAGVAAPILLTAQPESSEAGTTAPPKGLEVLVGPPAAAGPEATVVQVLNSEQRWPTLKINNKEIPWATLQSTLRQLFQNRSEKVVLVKADERLPFAHVVHVIDTCRSLGYEVVLIAPGQ